MHLETAQNLPNDHIGDCSQQQLSFTVRTSQKRHVGGATNVTLNIFTSQM